MVPGAGQRIPSLDGLRAVSISFVLIAHLSGTAGFPHFPYFVQQGMSLFGVRVFFVISAFLITSLLLHEESRTGTVSLRHFYFRRTLRIFPPFYAYVGVVALVAALGWIELREFDLLSAVTYTTNYHPDRSWYLGHAWSLAVEEQFYLLWPFVLKYLGPRRAPHAALVAVIVAPVLRIALLVLAPSYRDGIGETFPTVADSIATGCLLACYRDRLAAYPRWIAFLRARSFWIIPGLALAAAFVPWAKVNFLVGQTFTNLGIALVIERVVRFPQDFPGRFLNARPVAYVGVLSYSLYLWQQPFLNRHTSHAMAAFPLNIVLTFGVALASYYLIERPALRLRARIEVAWKTRAHAIPADPPRLGLG
jgi:peptidoglycan/LPS O-acetylase OafA/YrhL